MLFSSMLFLWLFFPIVIFLYYIVSDKYKNFLLLLSSLVFYAWGEPKYILLMLTSITVNYVFGLFVSKVNSIKKAKILLGSCLSVNLAMLVYFKYFNFIIDNINNLFSGEINTQTIILPIGISFYTFQALSYVIDVYRWKKTSGETGVQVQKNYFNLALYISFFPQLIAGPIINYKDVEKQIEKREVTVNKFAYGLKRFVFGLSKKVLISNILAANVDKIFSLTDTELNTPIVWVGIICYTFQIYYDFSGYSDMAIGLGKMFGFDYIENFNYPYISKSITEFWKRWHISLSNWFREYLYIPLGGNRKGLIRTYINLGIVFLATGIWHGANWTFILWGVWHGFFMIIERIFLSKLLNKNKIKILNHCYTMTIVMIGWIFFRSDTLEYAIVYLKNMFFIDLTNLEVVLLYLDKEVVFFLAVAIVFSGFLQNHFSKFKERLYNETQVYSYEFIVIPILLFICIAKLTSGAYNPFIYFQF